MGLNLISIIRKSLSLKMIALFFIFLILFLVITAGFTYIILHYKIELLIKKWEKQSEVIKTEIVNHARHFQIPTELLLNGRDQKTFFEEQLNDVIKKYPDIELELSLANVFLKDKQEAKITYNRIENKHVLVLADNLEFDFKYPFKSMTYSWKTDLYMLVLQSLFISALIVIAILTGPLIFFTQKLTRPLKMMIKGTQMIAGGELGYQLNIQSQDEVGAVSRAFNNMSLELQKIKKIRDELLAIVSHELRSPLSRIRGYSELIQDLKFNKSEKDKYFEALNKEVNELDEMITEIIEISRMELGREKYQLEEIPISGLISRVMKKLERYIKGLGVKIHKDVENFDLVLDTAKMERVLINLVQNSIKADSKNITIRARKNGSFAKICVIDDGIGIPDEEKELVFEKFYRIDKSRSRNTGGFGLGLSIAKEILKSHSGKIYFDTMEKGAMVVCKLPLTSMFDLS